MSFVDRHGLRSEAQRTEAALDERQRARRGDAEEAQAVRLHPGMPGAARPPGARDGMAGTLDVVALDDQLAAFQFDQRQRCAPATLEGGALFQPSVRIGYQGRKEIGLGTDHGKKSIGTSCDLEQAAVAQALVEVVGQAPLAGTDDGCFELRCIDDEVRIALAVGDQQAGLHGAAGCRG